MATQMQYFHSAAENDSASASARRVFLVDDHAILREGVTALLSLESKGSDDGLLSISKAATEL